MVTLKVWLGSLFHPVPHRTPSSATLESGLLNTINEHVSIVSTKFHLTLLHIYEQQYHTTYSLH